MAGADHDVIDSLLMGRVEYFRIDRFIDRPIESAMTVLREFFDQVVKHNVPERPGASIRCRPVEQQPPALIVPFLQEGEPRSPAASGPENVVVSEKRLQCVDVWNNKAIYLLADKEPAGRTVGLNDYKYLVKDTSFFEFPEQVAKPLVKKMGGEWVG